MRRLLIPIYVIFGLTVLILRLIAKVIYLSYNEVNVIVWYMALPILWAVMLDYKLHIIAFSPLWLASCIALAIIQRKRFKKFCDNLFTISQMFLLNFGNYYISSVIVCLIIPIAFTVILALA